MFLRRLCCGLLLALTAASAARADENRLIYGIHDAAGWSALQGKIGWVVETTTVKDGADPLGYLRPIADSGVTVIVRVNNGYGAEGTIPRVGSGRRYGNYGDFANAVAAMVRKSPHVKHWIIGNEPNLDVEWPADASGRRVPITVDEYFECYTACWYAIHAVEKDAIVIPAPVAPYAPDLGTGDGDSLAYFTKLMAKCASWTDAVALHAYTHGQDPALASSEARMATLPAMHSELRVYRDFLGALPGSLRAKPVYLTECDPGHFTNANTGWVRAVFDEVRDWNARGGTQKIRCVCLYRWSDADPGYGLEKVPEVQKDLEAACAEKTTWPDAPTAGPGMTGALAGATSSVPPPASPAPAPAPAKPAATVYTIDFGDTLSSIAEQSGLTLEQLLDFTGGTDMTNRERLRASSPLRDARWSASLIFPGQKLLLPL